jgi:hypothetical protein
VKSTDVKILKGSVCARLLHKGYIMKIPGLEIRPGGICRKEGKE